jgi:GTP-binding protein HflX
LHRKPREVQTEPERAILFGTLIPGDGNSGDMPLKELTQLADTAGARVFDTMVQKRSRVNPTYYIGKGMAEELARLARDHGANVLISDNDLSPAQARNLERITGCRVVDRTELILDIFSTHAKTRQAKVQVELAQLQYALPRLKRMWTHLSRMEGGIGFRGPGEKQLESDRRLVKRRIADLRRVLVEIQKRKEREVRARANEFTVSLVGYTNAGKSTVMNALTGAGQLVEDKLFATLDTKTRLLKIEKGRRILLSDTVGFIKKIPHHLIASFHATLEEVTTADLLLHVVDVSQPDPISHISAVRQVLKSLGCNQKPCVILLNKVDRLMDRANLEYFRRRYKGAIPTSALKGEGLSALKRQILMYLEERMVEREIHLPAGAGKLLAFVSSRGKILWKTYEGEGLRMGVRIEKRHLGKLHKLQRQAEQRSGG